MKYDFLKIISESVTCDTGNWGECGGLNKKSKIDASEEMEKFAKQKMKEFADWHYDVMTSNPEKYPNCWFKDQPECELFIKSTDELINEFLNQSK